ncbi:MAG: alpha/beta fold hydrolase [Solirubrobacteraceae bacterium]
MHVEEHTITLAGAPVFYRSAGHQQGDQAPVVYVHGAPTSSDDWLGLLERTGGVAPDLPGFGRTGKGGHLAYTPEALADFLGDLLSELGLARVRLVSHGWGAAAAVLLAARQPGLVQRLVLFNAVPLLDGLRWPWWARTLRIRAIGELQMGSTTKSVLRRWLRQGSATPGAWPSSRVAQIWEQFDQGTQRAIIRLQRSVDEERMSANADSLDALTMPTLVVWGERDPWWGAQVLDAYTGHLPGARVERISEAGHWPWLDAPAVVDLVAGFLDEAH